MRYYSEVLNKILDSPEACTQAEHAAKVEAARQQEERAKAEAAAKEKREKEAAERKAAAAEVEAARKAMVDAQRAYAKVLDEFVKKYGSYHYTTSSVKDIPLLFDFISDWI